MSPTRRDFLKGITIAGLGIGARVTLPDGRQGEIEEIGPLQEDGTLEAKVLLYWYCHKCGAMNTQSMPTCKLCREAFTEDRTIKVDIGANPHLGKEVWR